MHNSDPIDLAFDPTERALLEDIAALQGTPVAEFTRTAALEKARGLAAKEIRIDLSNRDFWAVVTAVERPFEPNEAMRRAIWSAHLSVRRA